jgi:hypothetical protein
MLLFLYVSLALVPRPLLHGATSVHPRAPRRPLPRLAVSDAELVRELCQREHVGRVMLLLRRLSRGYTGGQVQVWRPIFVADAFWKPLDLLVIGLLGGLLPKLASALSSVLGNKVPPEPASVIGTRGRIARALGSTLGVLYVCDSLACAVGRLWPLQAGSAARGAEILSCITISLGAVRVLTYISRRCIGSYFGMDSSDGNLIGRVAVADRTVTWLIWLVAGASCAEVISLEMGIALKSLFALGGLSSIVFALALKETAAEVLAGLIITATEPFLPGDDIECVGTRGRVERFGWYQSRVRLASGDLAFVPNSALAGKQLINHSRRIPASTTHIEASLRLRCAKCLAARGAHRPDAPWPSCAGTAICRGSRRSSRRCGASLQRSRALFADSSRPRTSRSSASARSSSRSR